MTRHEQGDGRLTSSLEECKQNAHLHGEVNDIDDVLP